MKRIIRCVCVTLVIAILLTSTAYATEGSSSRASNYFMHCSVYLDEMSTYTFKVCFDVTALGIMDVLGASEVKVQRSLDGENWTTTRTYTKADYPHMVDENQITHGSYIIYTGASGYYYRARVILYAKNSSGVAESTHYTGVIKIGG